MAIDSYSEYRLNRETLSLSIIHYFGNDYQTFNVLWSFIQHGN